MGNARNIAVFLIILFCTNSIIAGNGSDWFLGGNFNTVRTLCQNNETPEENDNALEKPSAAPVGTFLINCHEVFIATEDHTVDALKTLTLIDYFYKVKFKDCAVIDKRLPPPKIS